MSRKIHGRSAFRRLMRLEALERREVLAGNVTATVAGSTLIVRGNGEDNIVAIIQIDDGRYSVAGLDTDVNNSATAFDTPAGRTIRNIIVDLGNGDDILAVGNDAQAIIDIANVSFGVGGGDIEGELGVVAGDLQDLVDDAQEGTGGEFFLNGSLTIKMGNGDDLVAISGDFAGSIVANLGASDPDTDGDAFEGNSFGINGGALFDGESSVGGSIAIVGGTRVDEVAVGATSIRGALSAALSNGDNAAVIDGLDAASVAITGGSGIDDVSIIGTGLNTSPIVALSLGNGENTVEIDGSELRNLSIVTGSGEDDIALGVGDPLEIALNLVVSTGNGDDTVAVAADVGFNISINTGAGAGSDFVELTGTGVDDRLARNVVIATGNDADGVDIDTAEIQGSLTINTGSGDDNLNEAVGAGGGGTGGVNLANLLVTGSLSVLTGAGEDTVNVQSIQVNLNATLDTGNNDDDVVIDDATVLLNFFARLGAGEDELDISNSSALRAYLYGGSGNNDRGEATNVDADFFFATQFENGNLAT